MIKTFDKGEISAKRVMFETAPFDNETEILGPIKLHLWASSSTDDMDIFVSLRNINPQGKEVVNSGALTENFPISQGWLRASLRKLDEELSTEYKPYYAFDEVQKLIPGKVYPLDIEIWDSSVVLSKGHRLLLEIGSQNQSGCALLMQTSDDRNWDADTTIYTGGKYASYLLLPVIP
ncbi:putative CocE/NonD family hydrolase [Paenibacillus brasilensis]|uniref:CocE/NonD family hydrolase n=1 Tax=Paenibacillus brasilensis TaxID=128574 RepID=A0ABU0L6X4_9BACL|nr:putative CocE/NonD family hydrolase [Paenibacillus brasilensis]